MTLLPMLSTRTSSCGWEGGRERERGGGGGGKEREGGRSREREQIDRTIKGQRSGWVGETKK